ncbi:hypothetical protein SK128_016467, partial [Halocaridina rubra]
STLPVVEIEVLKRVSGSSVASSLFGQPIYLMPTGATSLSFEDIWENRQYVSCLSRQLNEKDEGLLSRVLASPGTLTALVAIFPASHCNGLYR